MQRQKSEQELFWESEFGNEYVQRNQGSMRIAANIALFAKILGRTRGVRNAIEFGANIGLNLRALQALVPNIDLTAVEINQAAIQELEKLGNIAVKHTAISDFEPDTTWDLALIKGVLIHIAPEQLGDVYDRLYRSSNRYICIVEYYNPTPVAVTYRGHQNKLFKRDFAGDVLDRFQGLQLLDYGFVYKRDALFPQDDCTWFLLEKCL